MRYLKLALIVLVALFFPIIATAQEDDAFVNDPTVNESANACLAGGSMEGKCDIDSNGDGIATQEESDWAWNCGWYLIRFEYGLIPLTQFPVDCISLIQYQVRPLCIMGFLYYTGIPNELRNVHFYLEEGCSGQGHSFGDVVIVQSDSIDTAIDLCTNIFGENTAGLQIYQYPGEEEDLWLCIEAIPL